MRSELIRVEPLLVEEAVEPLLVLFDQPASVVELRAPLELLFSVSVCQFGFHTAKAIWHGLQKRAIGIIHLACHLDHSRDTYGSSPAGDDSRRKPTTRRKSLLVNSGPATNHPPAAGHEKFTGKLQT